MMPVALPIALAIAQAIADPAIDAGQSLDERVREAWFGAGEQGWFLDPSNFASMYQDANGTTPVTGVEQPVGLMLDTRFGLARGPELRDVGAPGVLGTATAATYDTTTGNGTASRVDASNISFISFSGLAPGAWYEVTIASITGAGAAIRNSVPGGSTTQATNLPVGSNVRATVFATSDGKISLTAAGNGSTTTLTGVSVRHIPGNHFYQTTTANRPVLRARYNYLHNTVDPAGSSWGNTNSTTTAVGDGFFRVTDDTATGSHTVYKSATGTVPTLLGQQVTCSIVVRAGTSSRGRIAPNTAVPWGGAEPQIRFNLVDGTITSLNSATGTIEEIEPGVFRVTMTTPAVSVASGTIGFALRLENDAGQASYTGDGTRYLDFKEPTLEPGATATRYQWVDVSGNYDTEGFPVYLSFDGTDDCLMSNAVDFTGTDKVTVLAGITKLSDASTGVVVETSANAGNSAGAFGLYAPITGGDASFTTRSHGTTAVTSTASGYASPVSAVITASADIGAPSLTQRINGASASGNTNSQGTGNYGNYPAFIGARNNASNRFNGRVYFLAARGAWTEGEALEMAETLAAKKMGIAA